MKLSSAMLFLLATKLMAQEPSLPKVSAFFDRIDDGPAFFVECPNTSGKVLSSSAIAWGNSLRLDGAIVPNDLNMGPGLTTDVQPGQLWHGIIALRQSQRPFFPSPKFGALVRSARVVPLKEGKHTLAVQCLGVWSDDFVFYWETETHP